VIEKGLQLIATASSTSSASDVRVRRAAHAQLLEGINYEEIVNEVNRGAGRLPGLIGFDPDRAAGTTAATRSARM